MKAPCRWQHLTCPYLVTNCDMCCRRSILGSVSGCGENRSGIQDWQLCQKTTWDSMGNGRSSSPEYRRRNRVHFVSCHSRHQSHGRSVSPPYTLLPALLIHPIFHSDQEQGRPHRISTRGPRRQAGNWLLVIEYGPRSWAEPASRRGVGVLFATYQFIKVITSQDHEPQQTSPSERSTGIPFVDS